jgi:hypothetical protein
MCGWIKTHRDLLEHPRASDPNWLALWMRLLCMATHREKKVIFNGKLITLKPGQLISTRAELSSTSGISDSTVHRLLFLMESEQQIEQQTTTVSRLVTIVNWDKYQSTEQPFGQPVNNERTTNEQPPLDHIYKEWKNDKNTKGCGDEAVASSVAAADAAPSVVDVVKVKPKKTPKTMTDEEWMVSLKAKDCYKHINIDHQFQKMQVWCETRNQKPTRKKFVGWLNRQDAPMAPGTLPFASSTPSKPSSIPFGYSTASPDSKTPISEKTAIVSAKELKGALEEETQKELALAVKDEDSVQY